MSCHVEEGTPTGSRIAVFLDDEFLMLHRSHPGNEMDRGAVASLRRFLEQAGVRPN